VAVILLVEDDADVAAAIELNLRLEGHEVHHCADGRGVADLAREVRPDLVLLDLVLPGADGLTVARELRADTTTASTPILMLTARTSPADRLAGFEAGADDYILKPFDTSELLARVRATLRRSNEMKEVSPLTSLPGNFRITDELERRAGRRPFAVVYVDINWFKSFNDHYGFLRGDEVIRRTADILVSTLRDLDPEGFAGHVGGDDFVVVCAPGIAADFAERVIDRFDGEIPALYDPDDAARGWIETVDRQGERRRHPLVSIALGIATTDVRPLRSRWEASEIASEMKRHAKRQGRSAFEIDRRRD
jgi:PleD family two-component response regulator